MLIHSARIDLSLHAVARMIRAFVTERSANTTATVSMHCNEAENILEAALADVRKAKSEARLICYRGNRTTPLSLRIGVSRRLALRPAFRLSAASQRSDRYG